MDIDNFVYYQKGGKVMSLGYEVDCKLMNKDLSVPAGLFILNKSIYSNTNNIDKLFDDVEESNVIDENLYDNLLELMDPKVKKNKKRNKKTRKRKKNKSKRKTKSKR